MSRVDVPGAGRDERGGGGGHFGSSSSEKVACASKYSTVDPGAKSAGAGALRSGGSAPRPGRGRRFASLARIPSLNSEDTIRGLLSAPGTWAVVGCSPSPHRDSHRIAALLQRRGNRIIPVNPTADGEEILGEPCRRSLTALPGDAGVEVVDIFRRADAAGAHVDEAIEIGARAVWMQLGVIDHAAAERAQAAGLDVIMDRCPAIEVRRLGI